jgi:hypothetical protein
MGIETELLVLVLLIGVTVVGQLIVFVLRSTQALNPNSPKQAGKSPAR